MNSYFHVYTNISLVLDVEQELKRCNAQEKLKSMSDASGITGASASTPRMRASMMTSNSLGQRSITTVMGHCAKLVRILNSK